jgi:hypothetical protein
MFIAMSKALIGLFVALITTGKEYQVPKMYFMK